MTQQWQPDPYQRRPLDIDAYAPPKRSGGIWWFLALGAVLIGVVLAVLFLRPDPQATPANAPSPTPASGNAGPGMPFTMPGSKLGGRWEIISQRWSDSGLIVRIKVTADRGAVSYGFAAFSNNGIDLYRPTPGAPAPEIGRGSLIEGQSVEGNVFLEMPRGPATLILTTRVGRQLSALPVAG